MTQPQVPVHLRARFTLHSERLGPLPLINHFIERMGLQELLERYVPTTDRRCVVPHARALGVLLRSIVVEKEPMYRQGETAHGLACELLGLSAAHRAHLCDRIASGERWIDCSTLTGRGCSPRW